MRATRRWFEHQTVKKPSAQSGKRKSSDRNDSTYCMLHGKDKGHDSSECKVLMAQAKRMRGMYDSRSEADRAKTRKENRYDNNYKKKPNGKAELHALIAEQVQRELKQQKAAIGKRKRKKDLHVAEMPSDVSEQGDDEVSIDDMDQFNFENLKVDISDDDLELDNLSLWANGQIEPNYKTNANSEEFFHLTDDNASLKSTTSKQFTTLDACLNYHIADRNDKECNLICSIHRPTKRPRTQNVLTPIVFENSKGPTGYWSK